MYQVMNKKHLFLCGLHRSGTSILFQILRDHPSISGFTGTGVPEDEGQHLQTVFPRAIDFGGPGVFGFNSKAYLDDKSQLVSSDNKKKLILEWGKYWDSAKDIFLEKSPPNLLRTLFLQEMFPNTIFIVIVRHPIATSYATQKWSKTSVENLINHWVVCHDQFLIDSTKLKNVILLRYEIFVAQPNEVIKKIYECLGVDMMQIEQKVRKDINIKYFTKWNNYQRHILTRGRAKKIIKKYEQRVNLYGYSLRSVDSIARNTEIQESLKLNFPVI